MEYRNATADDEDSLWELLTYASSMTGPLDESIAIARADPYLSGYVHGFGARPGDLGVLAVQDGAIVGGAWFRLDQREVDAHGHAVATATEPELAIALRPAARGQGVGNELLRRLLERADRDFPATVLSVRSANPSARLYARHGYEPVGKVVNRVGSESIVMRRVAGPGRSG